MSKNWWDVVSVHFSLWLCLLCPLEHPWVGGMEGQNLPYFMPHYIHLLPRIESSLKCMGSNLPNSKKTNK